MNFSELFKQTHHLCKFSPSGEWLANTVQYRMIIREVATLQVRHLFTCLDAIQHIDWAGDSMFVLCAMYKRGLIQVWSIEHPEWTCKIDEGSAGLIEVLWSPDARHILSTAEFHLRVSVWSLTTKSVSYIKHPKSCQKGKDFSKEGRYLALAERRDCKDCISIFTCSNWELIKHFDTDTEDLAGIEWSPDSHVLGVWDTLLKNKVLLYSVDGRCLATFSPYQDALGVKSVCWSSSSQFLAIGYYDQKVRIINHLTWKTITVKDHPATIDDEDVVVYKEIESKAQLHAQKPNSLFATQSKYEIQENPVQIPANKPDINKANPKLGVGTVVFSHDSRYMYTRNDNMPHTLWIWDIHKIRLIVVLVQAAPIKCIAWDPTQSRLAMCTGTNKLYMWSPVGSLSVEVPVEATFHVDELKWRHDGNALLLIGKDEMCICFLQSNSSEEEPIS